MNFNFTNDQYAQVYGEQYTRKIEYLSNAILNYKTEGDNFNVLNFETGVGKSRYTDITLYNYLSDWGMDKNFLIVKRFNSEIESSVKGFEVLEEFLRPQKVVWGFGKPKEPDEKEKIIPVTLGITYENWNEEWKYRLGDLKNIRIIYISHQRYIKLSLDEEIRSAFTKNRHVLIVDEKVNFPIYTYNDKRYSDIRAILPHTLRFDFDKVCKKLNDIIMKHEIERHTNQCIRVEAKIHPATLENFKNKIEDNWDNIKGLDNKRKLEEFMDGLDLWYSMKSVYNGGNISTHNPEHHYWGLKNNILLDASAVIDGYRINTDKFRIIHQSRIIDHSNCKFTFVDYNSSKSNLKSDGKKFFGEIAQKICERRSKDDKTLIVCHKENAETIRKNLIKLHPVNDIWLDKMDKDLDSDYNNQSIAISWLGNLIGKNTFSDFTQVWIVGTPNIPYEQYLVSYMQYTDEDLGKKSLSIVKGKFVNEEFLQVQLGIKAAEIYQSIKRIQRNAVPKGEFFILNNDEDIKSLILSQMKGAKNIEIMDLDFIKEEEEEKQNNKKSDQVEQFIEYILEQKKGKYKKKEISEELGITKLNRVLADVRVESLTEKHMNKIKIHTRYIEVL